MAEKSHTPGPWELQDHRRGAKCWTVAAPSRCYVVAELECDHDEAEANARLIAASPDLLAACEAIVSGWGHQDGVSRAVALAREAIARIRR